jgi:ADP-ribose diphosphatase
LPKPCAMSHNARNVPAKAVEMSNLQKPKIQHVETVARSRLFTIEAVDLTFSNGECRVYERMRPTDREAVMIAPLLDDHLLLIREYTVGTESYELGFPKGLMDPGETVEQSANRELKEEIGFGARELTFLKQVGMAPSYFSSKMNILVAESLYPEKLEGDEPEPLPLVRWPLASMMDLLNEPDFSEARNISALFLLREWLIAQGRLPSAAG